MAKKKVVPTAEVAPAEVAPVETAPAEQAEVVSFEVDLTQDAVVGINGKNTKLYAGKQFVDRVTYNVLRDAGRI